MDKRSSYLTLNERLCAVFMPFMSTLEAVALTFASCFHYHSSSSHTHRFQYSFNDLVTIANNSLFTVNEVEALLELFKKLSSSIFDDGLLHKRNAFLISCLTGDKSTNRDMDQEELKLALLTSPTGENLILDRVFELFDEKKNGVIDFEEFVHVISVYHPRAPMQHKIDFAFRLYDLRQTGFIEREGVRQMLNAILLESGLQLSDENLEAIIDKTFADADADNNDKINREEWEAFVFQNPALLKNMTLPYLKDITTMFPSFIFNTEVDD